MIIMVEKLQLVVVNHTSSTSKKGKHSTQYHSFICPRPMRDLLTQKVTRLYAQVYTCMKHCGKEWKNSLEEGYIYSSFACNKMLRKTRNYNSPLPYLLF
jgi:predicted RNA-binding Zn-ribbon protein involved in translation (DUF1610 family)